MRNLILKASVSLALFGLTAGCQNKMYDENVALHNQNRELQSRLSDSDSKLRSAPDPAQLASMQQQLADRDAKIADLQQQLAKPQPSATPEENNALKGIEVTRDDRAGTVTVNLPGDVLFTSGSADLKQSAKTTLDKVSGAINKNYGGKHVIVQGYTDTDPISRTKEMWKDNLDLSAARARTVATYLSKSGLSSGKIGMQAYGETMPKTSKDRSRRVEIVVATR